MSESTTKNRPRILHVISGLSTGGAEWALHNILGGGIAARYDNHVISLRDKGDLGPLIEENGVPVSSLGLGDIRSSAAGMVKLRRLVRSLRFDLIQGWMYHGNLVAMLAKYLAIGAPAVAWNVRHSLYDIRHEKRKTQFVIRGGRLVSSSVDTIIYNSELSREQHGKFGFSRQHAKTIPNGIDTQRFYRNNEARQSIRRELSLPPDALVVGHVGRYHPMKDHSRFLKAVVKLCGRDEKVHAVLVGRDVTKQNSELVNEAADLLDNRIHFLGERSDMPKVMCGLDVLCQSSWSEAFPNVLGEAMASEVPCLATDVGDSARIIGDTGLVVPPANTNSLLTAMEKLVRLSDEERMELGRRARHRIVTTYAMGKIVDIYDSTYRSLIAGSGAP